MNIRFSKCSEIKFLTLTLLLLSVCTAVDAADDECQMSGGWDFVCGPQNAEDLVLVPGTRWIISSGMAPGAAILLIDSKQKTWTELYPADTPGLSKTWRLMGLVPVHRIQIILSPMA